MKKEIIYVPIDVADNDNGYVKVENDVRMKIPEITNTIFGEFIMESYDNKTEIDMDSIDAYLERQGKSIMIKELKKANKDTKDYLKRLDAFTVLTEGDELIIRGLDDITLDRDRFECAKFGREQKEKQFQNP